MRSEGDSARESFVRRDSGIPRLAKGARRGAPSVRGGGGRQQDPHRAFSPVRNDKVFEWFELAQVTNVHLLLYRQVASAKL